MPGADLETASEGGAGRGADRQDEGQQGQQSERLETPPFDVKTIPEYDGSTNVVEWLEQASLLCSLRNVSLMAVLPTRLRGGAFAVWSRMSPATRHDLQCVKAKLFKAFALDPFAAQAELVRRHLRPGESADVFLAALQQLAELMGGLPEKTIAIFFVNGLPEAVRAAVRDGIDDAKFNLEQILDKARSVLSRADVTDVATVAAVRGPPPQRSGGGRGPARQRGPVRCWQCGQLGHIARLCPNGNGGGAASAQVPPPPPTAPGAERQ